MLSSPTVYGLRSEANATKTVLGLRQGLRAVLFLVVLALLCPGVASFTDAGMVDDAYIVLRYARNIWAGEGLVFNFGELVEGYTSPLWLVSLTLLWPIAVFPFTLAASLSALVGFSVVLLAAIPGNGNSRLAALVGVWFLSSDAAFIYWVCSAMGTALSTLLLTATVLMGGRDVARGRQPVRTGVLLASAALTRLETLWKVRTGSDGVNSAGGLSP